LISSIVLFVTQYFYNTMMGLSCPSAKLPANGIAGAALDAFEFPISRL
jgi:hypothetical protein